MGCATSADYLSDESKKEIDTSRRLDALIDTVKEEDKKIIKLLLLGTGDSGKSTIFKQMQILYTHHGFTDYDKNLYFHVIRRNVIECIQTLIGGVERFKLKYKNSVSEQKAKELAEVDELAPNYWTEKIIPNTQHLWLNEPAIKEVYAKRNKIHLLDSCAYFFDRLDEIGKSNYVPNTQDILRSRVRTTGIVERIFNIQNVLFKFLDVGGQRNERRKWIHCFEDVTAVIYVTAIQEYDEDLYEDETKNRLHESINVFEQIINNKYLMKSTVILFLNKKDLFEEKIKNVSLNECFQDYIGDNSFKDATAFIEDKFREVNQDSRRLIFAHLTCATDTNNVQKVFDACKVTILAHNLSRLGLK